MILYLHPVKYILPVIFFFNALCLTAQKSIWENEKLSPDERLQGLEEWIWADYMQTSPDEAYRLAETYLKFAQAHKIDKHIATGLHLKGVSRYFKGEYDAALTFYNESLSIRKRIADEKGISSSLNNIAVVYKMTGQFQEAITIYLQCAEISNKIKDTEGVAIAYGNMGVCYQNMGEMDKALQYSIKSMNIFKELNTPEKLPNILRTIGTLYIDRGEHAKGIPYLEESLKIAEQTNDLISVASAHEVLGMMYGQLLQSEKAMIHLGEAAKIYENAQYYSGLIINYNNVAGIYLQNKDYVLAEKFYRKTLFILKLIDEPISEAASLNGIAHIHLAEGNIDSATYYLDKSMEIRLKINDPYGLANNYLMQMDLFLAKNNVSDALDAGKKAMENAIQSKYLLAQRDIAERMYKIHKNRNEPFKALQMHELYYSLRDSIDKTENQKEIIRREYSYQYEKQSMSDSLRREEDKRIDDERHRSELQQEETRRNSLFVILALVLLFALFIFNRFRVIKKQRDVIRIKEEETARQKALLAHQNETLEEKQKEIFDSINYARRLQDAILPPNKLVQKLLPDGFILYQPKDIVAGDFYWLESTGAATYLAAADCTGHGVPGAMVSVVCSNALTKALHEDKLTEPGKILDRTRELVIEQFARSEQEVKDGMDVSLVAWPLVGTDGLLSLQWAGANNPLWIIKDGTNEVIEIKADKQPVGNYSNALPFTTHLITLQKGDAIYIFTDGFQDQFGGEKGKKFKAANLKQLLLSIQHETMSSQKEIIATAFENWRGTIEQVDDVCVIGVRL